jgi:hypothetical protein
VAEEEVAVGRGGLRDGKAPLRCCWSQRTTGLLTHAAFRRGAQVMCGPGQSRYIHFRLTASGLPPLGLMSAYLAGGRVGPPPLTVEVQGVSVDRSFPVPIDNFTFLQVRPPPPPTRTPAPASHIPPPPSLSRTW